MMHTFYQIPFLLEAFLTNILFGIILWVATIPLFRNDKINEHQKYNISKLLQIILLLQFIFYVFVPHPKESILKQNNELYFINIEKIISISYSIILTVKLSITAYHHLALQNIRPQYTPETRSHWQEQLQHLQERIKLPKKLNLYFSYDWLSPYTFGIIKPIIVLPMAAVNNLSPKQMEAVLLHELIHIKHNDYLWKIIQIIIENILFFNPLVYIIGNKIKLYREASCDEAVVQITQNNIIYAESLLQLARNNLAKGYKITNAAISGNDQSFKYRISRILSYDSKKIKTTKHPFYYSILGLCGLLLLLQTYSLRPQPADEEKIHLNVNDIGYKKATPTISFISENTAVKPFNIALTASNNPDKKNTQKTVRKQIKVREKTKININKNIDNNIVIENNENKIGPNKSTTIPLPEESSDEGILVKSFQTSDIDSSKMLLAGIIKQLKNEGETIRLSGKIKSTAIQITAVSYSSKTLIKYETIYLISDNYIIYLTNNSNSYHISILRLNRLSNDNFFSLDQ